MSDKYTKPANPPPSYNNAGSAAEFYNSGPQDHYQSQQYTGDQGTGARGYPQQGYPQQGYQQGYYQPQGYQQGYYQQQQQPMYVQQQRPQSGNNGDCLTACLAGMCLCCTLDMLF